MYKFWNRTWKHSVFCLIWLLCSCGQSSGVPESNVSGLSQVAARKEVFISHDPEIREFVKTVRLHNKEVKALKQECISILQSPGLSYSSRQRVLSYYSVFNKLEAKLKKLEKIAFDIDARQSPKKRQELKEANKQLKEILEALEP